MSETINSAKFAASIVIPAHNEAGVIGRLLESLPRSLRGGDVQVIVACNGCTDNTADIARTYGVTVAEIPQPSKVAALNAADEVAVAFPRLYVDADITISRKTIEDLVDALADENVLYATPPATLDLAGRPWAVRAYYAVWQQVMRGRRGYVGAGVYALSEKGRRKFGRFPNLLADDLFVRNIFAPHERIIVDTQPTTVHCPWTLRAVLKRRVRIVVGNAQVLDHPEYGALPGSVEKKVAWWRTISRSPSMLLAAGVYALVNAVAYVLVHWGRRNTVIDWGQDCTTRSA